MTWLGRGKGAAVLCPSCSRQAHYLQKKHFLIRGAHMLPRRVHSWNIATACMALTITQPTEHPRPVGACNCSCKSAQGIETNPSLGQPGTRQSSAHEQHSTGRRRPGQQLELLISIHEQHEQLPSLVTKRLPDGKGDVGRGGEVALSLQPQHPNCLSLPTTIYLSSSFRQNYVLKLS